MKLLKRRPKSFDIQVQDMVLHITASPEYAEESRAAALSFWEQLESYALRDSAFRESKRASFERRAERVADHDILPAHKWHR